MKHEGGNADTGTPACTQQTCRATTAKRALLPLQAQELTSSTISTGSNRLFWDSLTTSGSRRKMLISRGMVLCLFLAATPTLCVNAGHEKKSGGQGSGFKYCTVYPPISLRCRFSPRISSTSKSPLPQTPINHGRAGHGRAAAGDHPAGKPWSFFLQWSVLLWWFSVIITLRSSNTFAAGRLSQLGTLADVGPAATIYILKPAQRQMYAQKFDPLSPIWRLELSTLHHTRQRKAPKIRLGALWWRNKYDHWSSCIGDRAYLLL